MTGVPLAPITTPIPTLPPTSTPTAATTVAHTFTETVKRTKLDDDEVLDRIESSRIDGRVCETCEVILESIFSTMPTDLNNESEVAKDTNSGANLIIMFSSMLGKWKGIMLNREVDVWCFTHVHQSVTHNVLKAVH